MLNLEGKRALVTGAAGGIGRAIVKTLHGQGATVGLADVAAEPLQALAGELGDRAHIFVGNLADAGAADSLAKDAAAAMGGIEILVNNAGITRDNLALRLKDEDWDLVLNVNLSAGFRLARAVLRTMMKARWGRIVGIASIVGATGNAGQANYAASKGGMVAMSKCLAQEVASRNVTVNCVAPGFIATPMTDALSDEQRAKLVSGVPSGRLGLPQDVANCVAFLVSEEAAYVTGQTLHVNGGMAMF